MSSICPKCGKFMEGGICEKCQAAEAAEKYEATQTKKKNWIPIIVIFALIIIIPLAIFMFVNHQYKMAERNKAEETYNEIVEYYEDGNLRRAVVKANEFNENYAETYEDLENDVLNILAEIEDDINEKTKSSDAAISANACETYLELFPNGKYVSQVKVREDQAEESLKYADSIVIDNGVAYFSTLESTQNDSLRFNISLDEFISNYNTYANELGEDISMKLAIIDGLKLSSSDFTLVDSGEDYKGILCDLYAYALNTSGYPQSCPMALQVAVEKESRLISYVSIYLSAENQTSNMRNYATYIHLLALQALTNSSDVEYYQEMTNNQKTYGIMAMYKNGLQISLASYSDFDELRIYPSTRKQWESDSSLNKIKIN